MPGWNVKPHVTPTVNVNLKPCDCGARRPSSPNDSDWGDKHRLGCAQTPVLIPLPLDAFRSVTFTVRLGGQEVTAVVWERESGEDSAPHLRGADGWTRCGVSIHDVGRPQDIPLGNLEAPLCGRCDRLRGVDASYSNPSTPIRVSCSISGKTWEESEAMDVETRDETRHPSAPRYYRALSAAQDRWALVKALVTGHMRGGALTPPLGPETLFVQRDAVYAALCEMARAEMTIQNTEQACAKHLPRADVKRIGPSPAASWLAAYVERLIERVSVLGGGAVKQSDACYSCERTEDDLNAVGRQLYVCEARNCSNQCCSDHSESLTKSDTGSDKVICLRCYDAAREDDE
jgi:hypothetical protein